MALGKWKPAGMSLAVVFLATGLEAIDLDCLLHPRGTVDISEVVSCPLIPPRLTVNTAYECEECGVMKGPKPASLTGYGKCGSGIICRPELDAINFRYTTMSIKIWNRGASGSSCTRTTLTGTTKRCNCPSCDTSPVLISLDDGALQLTGPENGVVFDLDADGTPEQTGWTEAASDDAFLVLDRNENGLIDDGQELFGNATPQPITDPAERNGFAALAVFDDSLSGGNENGFIDPDDGIFSDLQLWIDSNHNGISEADELQSLSEAGLEAIDLSYRRSSRKDAHGNEFRFKSKVHRDLGVRMAWDVFFRHQPLDPLGAAATKNTASSRSPGSACRRTDQQRHLAGPSAPR